MLAISTITFGLMGVMEHFKNKRYETYLRCVLFGVNSKIEKRDQWLTSSPPNTNSAVFFEIQNEKGK